MQATAHHQLTRIGLLVVGALLAVGVLAGAASASQWADAEQQMVDVINAERRAHGLPAVGFDRELRRVARDWTEVMARENRLYHNPDLATQVQRDWQRLGENVGWRSQSGASESELVNGLHQAFMDSPGHRANILRSDYNWVGVGVVVTSTGKVWTTVNFMQGAGQAVPDELAPGEFRDVNGGTHAPAISTISLAGITKGCTAELFCPDRQVTRGQMASFLTRALQLPPAARDHFSDDRGSAHEAAVNSLADAGIAQGCGDRRFCPNAPVSRAQMASFLQRGWDLETSSSVIDGAIFSDLGSSVHAPAINAIADAGITRGCGDGRYCPGNPVRRAEMASFLARALDLG